MNHVIQQITPPQNDTWAEQLRYYCQISQPDDPSLSFMVSMWSYALRYNGLTPKQAKSVAPYLEKMLNDLEGGLGNG